VLLLLYVRSGPQPLGIPLPSCFFSSGRLQRRLLTAECWFQLAGLVVLEGVCGARLGGLGGYGGGETLVVGLVVGEVDAEKVVAPGVLTGFDGSECAE
jgi:hypothetical protein